MTNPATRSVEPVETAAETLPQNTDVSASQAPSRQGGVTRRVVVFSLLTAFFFGFINPVIDAKLANTFLGAQHLPPGAVGVLLVVLLIVNPFTRYAAARVAFSMFMAGVALACAAL